MKPIQPKNENILKVNRSPARQAYAASLAQKITMKREDLADMLGIHVRVLYNRLSGKRLWKEREIKVLEALLERKK